MARAVDKSKLFQVPITGGINQAVDDRDAPPGTMTTVTNCRIKKSLLVQRPGFDAISLANVASSSQPILGDGTATVIEKPTFLARAGNVPLLGTTSGRVYASDSESGTPWFTETGFVSTCTPTGFRSSIPDSVDTTIAPGVATDSNGNHLVVYASTSAIIVSVFSSEGKAIGSLVLNSALASGSRCDRLVAFTIGAQFYVLSGVDNGLIQAIFIDIIQVSNGQLSLVTSHGVVATQTTSSNPCFFDAVATRTIGGNPCWAIVYSQGGASNITIASMTGAVTVRHSKTQALVTPNAGIPGCSIYWDSAFNYLWVGYQAALNVASWLVVSDDDPSTVIRATANITTVAGGGPPLFGGYHSGSVNSISTALYVIQAKTARQTLCGVADVTNGSSQFFTSPFNRVISKPDNFGRAWFLVSNDTPLSQRARDTAIYWYVLARLRPVSSSADARGMSIELNSGSFVNYLADPTDTHSYIDKLFDQDVGQFFAQAIGATGCAGAFHCNLGTTTDVRQLYWTTGEQDPHVASARGFPSLVTAGQAVEHLGYISQASATIGALALEVGFANTPIVRDNSNSTGTASRDYSAILVQADVYGRRHTSAPSLPLTLTKNQPPLSLTIDTVGLGQCVNKLTTGELNGPHIEVYSTVDGGTDFFLSATVPLTSWPAQETVSLTRSDDELAAQSILYTGGGVQPNVLAPSGEYCVFGDDRLAIAGGFDRRVITFSKIIIPSEPIQFSDSEAFQAIVPGEITALGFLDGTFIAFTADAIYQITGQGPTDEGIGQFDGPTLIWAGVGCSDHDSVLKTDDGIIYLNTQGFYLLPRGLGAPQFIGAQVRDETRANPLCLGAVLTQTNSYYLARFLMAASGATSSGVILTFDLQRQIWFKDVITIDGSTAAALSELSSWPSGFVLMRESLNSANTAPALLLEDETASLDATGGATISQSLVTAWVYPFQPGGYGHARKCQIAFTIIGTAATVNLSVQSDSNAAQTTSWAVTGSAGDIFYRELQLTPTQCGCIKVSLSETGGGAGIVPVSCTLEVDDDSGIRLLSPAERV